MRILSKNQEKFIENQEFYKEEFKLAMPVFFPFYSTDISFCSPENKKVLGKKLSLAMSNYHEGNFTLFLPRKELDEFAQHLIKKFENKVFFNDIIKKIEKENQRFEKLILRYNKLKNVKLNNEQIIKYYGEYINELSYFRIFAAILNILSMGEYTLMGIYKNMLSKNLSNEEFPSLTTSKNLTCSTMAEKELLELILKKQTDDKSLKKWIEKWSYIYYYYTGPIPELSTIKNMAKELDKGKESTIKRLKEIKNHSKDVASKKKRLIKKLGLNKRDIHLLDVLSYLNYYKAERKELMQKSYVACDNIFYHLNKLTGISINDLKFLTVGETKELLKSKDKSKFLNLINSRKKEFLYVTDSSGLNIFNDHKIIEKILKNLKTFTPSKKLLVAYSGNLVKGKIIIINTKKDMEKIKSLNEPFILASNSTYPDLLPAMAKAAGIITKVGGMTSHAAIVSRELKKPCIVGYSDLFEKFKEGDLIELDTKEGKATKV